MGASCDRRRRCERRGEAGALRWREDGSGTIARVVPDAVNTEVAIAHAGAAATAPFKASNVILAVNP
jgi:hypothetical protein